MNALKKLEDIQPSKPYNGFTKLGVGYYRIHSFRVTKNKFGKKGEGSNKSILIELDDQVLFLPQYFWYKINEDDIVELNQAILDNAIIYLYFGGKHVETK